MQRLTDNTGVVCVSGQHLGIGSAPCLAKPHCASTRPQHRGLLTLPFRVFFGLLFGILFLPFAILFLPFLLLRLVIKAAVLVFILPFVLIAAVFAAGVALIAVVFAILAPLLPFVVVGLIVWAVMRASRPAYAP